MAESKKLIRWTDEMLIADARQYSTRKEWQVKSKSAYSAAQRRNIVDMCCAHMTPRFSRTNEMLIADAAKYSTRAEWRRSSQGAYRQALRRGIMDIACAHMTKVLNQWTDEMLIADAAKYSSRYEWQRQSSAYQAALVRGLLDVACAHMTPMFTWTDEMLIADAAKYNTRGEWKNESGSAYAVARKRGLLDAACAHMTKVLNQWTDEMLIADAAKYSSRVEWQRQSKTAFNTAGRRGLMDIACAHMEPASGTDADAIYIWRAVGWYFNGEQVYKIGITSARLDQMRIQQVAKSAQADAEIVILAKVANARQLEAQLLTMGSDPQYSGFDGCTEFRAMSDEQLAQAVRMVTQPEPELVETTLCEVA